MGAGDIRKVATRLVQLKMDRINFETLNIEYYENVNLSDYCT